MFSLTIMVFVMTVVMFATVFVVAAAVLEPFGPLALKTNPIHALRGHVTRALAVARGRPAVGWRRRGGMGGCLVLGRSLAHAQPQAKHFEQLQTGRGFHHCGDDSALRGCDLVLRLIELGGSVFNLRGNVYTHKRITYIRKMLLEQQWSYHLAMSYKLP